MNNARLIISLDGHTLSKQEILCLQHSQVAGVILFAKNFVSKEQIKALCAHILSINHQAVISVDHEGGRVQRFLEGFTKIPMPSVWKDEQEAYDWGKQGASELKSVGVTDVLGPLVDLSNASSVLQGRCFSSDPETVITMASSYLDGVESAGIKGVIKHFPGHGLVSEDTHHVAASIKGSLEDCVIQDALKPFKELSKRQVPIMVSHIIVPEVCMLPVTLSKTWHAWIAEMLGVPVWTDCLSMEALAPWSISERIVLALDAGYDFVICAHHTQDVFEYLDGI